MLKKFVAVFVILVCSSSVAFAAPCAEDDLLCFQRELGKKADEALSLAKELESTKGLLSLEQQKSAAMKAAYDQVKETLPGLTSAIDAVRPKWYTSPILWMGIGLTLGFLATIAAIAAAGQTLLSLSPR
jgi:hypothetical protein